MAAGDGGRNFATPATVIVMAAKVGSTEQQRSSRSPSPTGASRPDGRPQRLPGANGRPAALVLWLCLVGWLVGGRGGEGTAAAVVEPGPGSGRAWRTLGQVD